MPFIRPTPERKRRLAYIQRKLTEYRNDGGSGALASAVNEMLQEPAFQRHVAANPDLSRPIRSDEQLSKLAWAFLYSLLYARDFVAAAMMLWDIETFTPEPHCTELVWTALMDKRMILIMGGGGLGKTYSPSAYFLLEWLLDPHWTRFQVASASEDHLKKNLYGDIIRLHQGASLKLPGVPDSESISLEKKRAQGIFTLVLPGGPQSKGKIKGSHTKPRPNHPVFGRRSRVFALIDEAQECPQNIFDEIPNRFSTVVGSDVDHLKFVVCANPKDMFSKFGHSARPKDGWESVKREDCIWESEEGWTVISLDAMQHENVKQRRIVYPGFVTWDGVLTWVKKCRGDWNAPEMFTYVYGKFPPQGTQHAVIPQRFLTASQREWIFDTMPESKAACDPAFTGDEPAFGSARVGRAIAWVDYNGVRHDLAEPQMKIQIDSIAILPKGDSQDLADENMARLKPLGVQPDGYAIDRTGAGQGTHDIIRRQWAQKVGPLGEGNQGIAQIVGIHYAEKPSEFKIADEDTQVPREMYDRIATELWFAAARLFELDVIGLGRGVDLQTFQELAARQGGMQPGLGRKLTVESKDTYKARTGNPSPDRADTCLMLLHVARISTPGLMPKARDTQAKPEQRAAQAWAGFNLGFDGAQMTSMEPVEIANMTQD